MTRRLSIILPIMESYLSQCGLQSLQRKYSTPRRRSQSAYCPTIARLQRLESWKASDRNYNLAPPISGQLTALYVKENDIVHRGDKLYTIDDRQQRTLLERHKPMSPRRRPRWRRRRPASSPSRQTSTARNRPWISRATYDDAAQIARRDEGLLTRDHPRAANTYQHEDERHRPGPLQQAIAQRKAGRGAIANAQNRAHRAAGQPQVGSRDARQQACAGHDHRTRSGRREDSAGK